VDACEDPEKYLLSNELDHDYYASGHGDDIALV
jgi:hypothetical protein